MFSYICIRIDISINIRISMHHLWYLNPGRSPSPHPQTNVLVLGIFSSIAFARTFVTTVQYNNGAMHQGQSSHTSENVVTIPCETADIRKSVKMKCASFQRRRIAKTPGIE